MSWSLKIFNKFPINLSSSIHARAFNSKAIGILGVPFDKGAGTRGTDKGPNALREAGLIDEIKHISSNIDVKDYGDVHYELMNTNGRKIHNLNELSDVAACNKALADKVEEIIKDNRMPITLGGCHSIAIGSISGVLRTTTPDKLGILWVDAHLDLNTNTTSPTGNMHGMPASLLVKELRSNWPTIPELEWCKADLSLRNFCWIGLRSIDYYERIMMEQYGIKYFDMRDIDRMGIDKVTNAALKAINPNGDRQLHVSFDIDSLDPLFANSTGTPAGAGLTLRECLFLMEEVHRSGTLSSMDLVEVNPLVGDVRDVTNTLNSAKAIVCAAIGSNRSGNSS